MSKIIFDGSVNHPGCNCGAECEMPCWQRIGIAPACDACDCVSFPEHAAPDPYDRGDELRTIPDLWPEIVEHISEAAADPARAIAEGLLLDERELEAKFRKGEAEHDRDWLNMTRDQIEREIKNEWNDLVLYHAMIRARFGASGAKETA